MPVGTPFSIGSLAADSILESCENGLQEVLSLPDRQVTLLLPCIDRYIMLAPNQDSECKLVVKKLDNSELPFALGYSGGEICPVPDANGKLRNRFHNYTFCACIF